MCSAVVIETVASPSHITELWKYVAGQVKEEQEQLKIARRLREGLLKTSPLAGFPKANSPGRIDFLSLTRARASIV